MPQAAHLPRGGVAVLGDSIVELQLLHTVCGLPAINASISGITTPQLAAVAGPIVAAAQPVLVIFVVGINETSIAVLTSTEQ